MGSAQSRRVKLLADLQSKIDSGSFEKLDNFYDWLLETGALTSGILADKDLSIVLQKYIGKEPQVVTLSHIDSPERQQENLQGLENHYKFLVKIQSLMIYLLENNNQTAFGYLKRLERSNLLIPQTLKKYLVDRIIDTEEQKDRETDPLISQPNPNIAMPTNAEPGIAQTASRNPRFCNAKKQLTIVVDLIIGGGTSFFFSLVPLEYRNWQNMVYRLFAELATKPTVQRLLRYFRTN